MAGYTCYRADHPGGRPRGGACVLIRQGLVHYHQQPIMTNHVQMAAVIVSTNFGEIAVAAAYLPPGLPWSTPEFSNLLDQLGQKFIVGGDFNAKHRLWGSMTANARGTALHGCLTSSATQVLATGRPTYYPYYRRDTPTCIDFYMYKGIASSLLSVREEYELSSDHLPLVASLSKSPQRTTPTTRLVSPGANIRLFQDEMNNAFNLNTELNTPEDVDKAVETFINKAKSAALAAAPTGATLYRDGRSNLTLSPEAVGLLTLKKRLRREYIRTNDPAIDRLYGRISNRVKKVLARLKREATDAFLEKVTPDEKASFTEISSP